MKKLRMALALLMVLGIVLASSASVIAADEYVPNEYYIYNFDMSDDEYTGPKYFYFSVYDAQYALDGVVAGRNPIKIYTLYNTSTKVTVPAYCTDVDVGAYSGHRYVRLNLEDSTYAGSVSGKLRAIVQEGFYLPEIEGETTNEHTARVNAKLKELGDAAGVTDLTIGEAINATQTAIWQVAHGTRLSFSDIAYRYIASSTSSFTKYHDLCIAERTNGHLTYSSNYYMTDECDKWVTSRIMAVHNYLLSLKPVAATETIVSPYSFIENHDPVVTKNSDGTYDVSVTTSVNVHMEDTDDLTLSAVLDSTHFTSVALHDGTQKVTVTIENVPASIAFNEVTLAIDGNQTVHEVSLYVAEAGRDTQQSMIGVDYSRSPVHTQVIAQESRIISFYKTTVVDVGNNKTERFPLENITFDIYFVGTMTDYLEGNVSLDVNDYDTTKRADFTILTDENGRGIINLTQHQKEDGVYLIIERNHPAIRQPIDPFFVVVPITNPNGEYTYDVDLQPKNDVKGEAKIEKDINSLGNKNDAVGVYEKHSWIISTNIPEDIADGKSFIVTDVFDNRLDYLGNIKVNVENLDGTVVAATLTEGTDYVLTIDDADSLAEGHPSDSFKLEVTHEGMLNIANVVGINFADYALRIHFDAQVNANAFEGGDLSNNAILEYTNSVNFTFTSESVGSHVDIGGVNLLKVDAKDHDKGLKGAVFEVYRVATEEEVANKVEGLTYLDGIVTPVVKVSFVGNHVYGDSVTSDENGSVAIFGLAYGKYYIVETSAPNGYNLTGEPIYVEVNERSHEEAIIVENQGGGILMPGTGGIGTKIFTIVGAALMLVAIVLLVSKKRMAK